MTNDEELEALKVWRADVTVALQREGGAFYADVPNHIRALVAGSKQSAMLNEALLKECRWSIDDHGGDSVYDTQCGRSFYFDDSSSAGENGFSFCGYCGGRLVEVRTSDEHSQVTVEEPVTVAAVGEASDQPVASNARG